MGIVFDVFCVGLGENWAFVTGNWPDFELDQTFLQGNVFIGNIKVS